MFSLKFRLFLRAGVSRLEMVNKARQAVEEQRDYLLS